MVPATQATLSIHLQPGARKDELLGFRDAVLWARVTAPPDKGQANRALLKLLARALGVAPSDVQLIRGLASRQKVVAIRGLSQEELQSRLSTALPPQAPP